MLKPLWSLTRGGRLTEFSVIRKKTLLFYKSGRLQEVVAEGDKTICTSFTEKVREIRSTFFLLIGKTVVLSIRGI